MTTEMDVEISGVKCLCNLCDYSREEGRCAFGRIELCTSQQINQSNKLSSAKSHSEMFQSAVHSPKRNPIDPAEQPGAAAGILMRPVGSKPQLWRSAKDHLLMKA